jgi:hypothetical protein
MHKHKKLTNKTQINLQMSRLPKASLDIAYKLPRQLIYL